MDNKQLLFIGGAGLIAVVLLRGKGSAAGTTPAAGGSTTPSPSYVPTPTYVPTGNEVADLLNQFTPPTQPAITPPIYPTGTGAAPVTPAPTPFYVDHLGIRHRLNNPDTERPTWLRGTQLETYRNLSNTYRLFMEDITDLTEYDRQQSGNKWEQVMEWYRQYPDALASTIRDYNARYPQTPIVPRW